VKRTVRGSSLLVASLLATFASARAQDAAERIALVDLDDGLLSYDLLGKDPKILSQHAGIGAPAWAPTPAWAPDRTRIAFVAGNDVHVVDGDGKNERAVASCRGLINTQLLWSPDGRSLAAVGRSSVAIIVDVASGKTTEVASDGSLPNLAGWCAWSPDSKRLFYADCGKAELTKPRPGEAGPYAMRPSGVAVCDVATGKTERFHSPADVDWIEPSLSPDASAVAFVRTNQLKPGADRHESQRELIVLDVASGAVTTIGEVHDGAHAWTADGGLVWLDRAGKLTVRDRAKKTDRLLAELPDDVSKTIAASNYSASAFAWAPGGKSLALCAAGSIFVIDVAAGTVAPRISWKAFDLSSVSWSAERRMIAGGRPTRVRFGSPPGRNALPTPDPPDLAIFVFDAEGKFIRMISPCKAFAPPPVGR
jgi:Tol biopolymer transport system component